jgi:predicted DNA binding CopG/RHH family protein
MKAVAEKKRSKKLPDFDRMTEDEIAEFWDNHSFVDYWDQMEEIEVVAKRPATEVVGLRLDKKDLEQIKRFSSKIGLGYSTLLRVWIKEKLLELQAAKSARK